MQRTTWRSRYAPSCALLLVIAAGAVGLAKFIDPTYVSATTGEQKSQANSTNGAEYFKTTIEPILVNRCYDCHSAATRAAGGLRLDDRDAILKGGKSGPAAIAGKPDESLLLHRILDTDEKKRMPKNDDALPEAETQALRAWIEQGLPWKDASVQGAHPADALSKPVSHQLVAYPRPATPEQLAYFEKKVRPILVNRCYNCHSDAFKEAGGLRVDVGISIFAGGNDGPVIIPGHPEKSLLIERIKSTDITKRMPQESDHPLPADEIATLEQWIKDGAAWPDETEKLPPTPAKLAALYPKLKKEHWAWQPLTDPAVPAIQNDHWSHNNIDRFILAKLQEKKLVPVKDADAKVLIRRVTYDLTGLPPTPDEVRAFEQNHSEHAYEALVDHLLSSSQFGERWGRHWLDIARYAESSGPSRNLPYPNAWRYRDYVIQAINQDVPYNRFIEEQIAGDLLPAHSPEEHDRLLIATGYLALGPKDVNQRFKARYLMDNVDDEIDTVTRSTMALTVSCARCHDHKFDPIPTTDYYALAGIFTSTQDNIGLRSKMGGASLGYYNPEHLGYLSSASKAPPVPQAEIDEAKKRLAEAKKAFDELQVIQKAEEKQKKAGIVLPALPKDEQRRRRQIIRTFTMRKEDVQLITDLGERGYGIHSVSEGVIADTTVRVRGIEEKHGPTVPRGFLSVLPLANVPAIPADHSGRLELAQWITRPDNPLTSRVYVNRVWAHLFGRGIVSTLDNFGTTGDTPANPKLLDYLAQDFIRNGWSTKKLVREIVLSRAYRLGSEVPAGYRDVDASNSLIWRHTPRRLEAEEIRDSILASSGQLDKSHPQGSASMALRMIEIRDDGPTVASVLKVADRSRYRSIYLPLLRDETPRPIAAFDPVSQTLVTGKRDETTVPSQALFMLNSPFVRNQSLAFADGLLRAKESDERRIADAYERTLGREPAPSEVARVKAFLSNYERRWNSGVGTTAKKLDISYAYQKAEEPTSLVAGVQREDGYNDQEEIDTPLEQPDFSQKPQSGKEAAWAAFVQSLYGSAAFQFVR